MEELQEKFAQSFSATRAALRRIGEQIAGVAAIIRDALKEWAETEFGTGKDKELQQVRDRLRLIEWSGPVKFGVETCPACGGFCAEPLRGFTPEGNGHLPGCWLREEIKKGGKHVG